MILLILVCFIERLGEKKSEFLFQGELYSATSNEPVFGVNDPLIQRSFSQGKQLRTQQHDSNWLRSKRTIR
jgi:hypothetical protein